MYWLNYDANSQGILKVVKKRGEEFWTSLAKAIGLYMLHLVMVNCQQASDVATLSMVTECQYNNCHPLAMNVQNIKSGNTPYVQFINKSKPG